MRKSWGIPPPPSYFAANAESSERGTRANVVALERQSYRVHEFIHSCSPVQFHEAMDGPRVMKDEQETMFAHNF